MPDADQRIVNNKVVQPVVILNPTDGVIAPTANSILVTKEIVRPADTTAYLANDVVGGVLEFPNMGAAAAYVLLMNARLRYDLSSVPSGMGLFRLQLYSVTPPSALADNAPWDLPSGDRAAYAGAIDLPTIVDVGSTLYCENVMVGPKSVKLGAAQTSLWAYLVTLGAYTPTSGATLGATLAGLTGV
jgi:hypothetical protein